jgi:hypothetical protein
MVLMRLEIIATTYRSMIFQLIYSVSIGINLHSLWNSLGDSVCAHPIKHTGL